MSTSEDAAFRAAEDRETNFCPEFTFMSGSTGRSSGACGEARTKDLDFWLKREALLRFIFGDKYQRKGRRRW